MTENETELSWSDKIGSGAYGSIVDMVAAVDPDKWDRLEELRDERDTWVENEDGDEDEQARTVEDWAKEFPEEFEELEGLEAMEAEYSDLDGAQERIQEDPLSVRVFGERINGDWEADKAELLLTTGGPAVRIMVELDQHAEPCRAWLEVQDWFKPWTQYFGADQETLLTYARQFCYE